MKINGLDMMASAKYTILSHKLTDILYVELQFNMAIECYHISMEFTTTILNCYKIPSFNYVIIVAV